MKKKKSPQKKAKVKIGAIFPVQQRVRLEAKNLWEREQQRQIDMMYCGRADLVGESVVIRTLAEMGGKIICPDCKSATRKVKNKKEVCCVKCKESWLVTYLPLDAREPSAPGPVHWKN